MRSEWYDAGVLEDSEARGRRRLQIPGGVFALRTVCGVSPVSALASHVWTILPQKAVKCCFSF